MNAQPTPVKRVAIWIRVSTEDQAAGESPQHHEFRARQYASFQDWTVVEVYDLAGVSGKSVMEHPECQRMLRDVKRGHIQALIFSKLARLARNTKELLEFAEVFAECKADLVSIQENIDTSTPAGRLFYTMIAAMAQWEREEIASRVKASVAVRAKLGRPLNGVAPFGYAWKDKKLVVVPEEAQVRKLLYELFVEHRRKAVVARMLNERGYRTRNGMMFRDMQVLRMLRCPSAKGVYRMNTHRTVGAWKTEPKPESEWGHVPVEPIVSEEVWDRANEILEAQAKLVQRPGKKPVHPFAGIVRCGCGKRMYVFGRSPSYACKKCYNKIEIPALDQLFVESVADTFADTDRVMAHLSNARNKVHEREQELAGVSVQIEKVRAEMKKALDLYMAGGLSVERFKEINQPFEDQLAQLQQELPRLEAETAALKVSELSAEAIVHEVKNLSALWPSLKVDEKQRLASLLCTEIVVPNPKTQPDAMIEITLASQGCIPTLPNPQIAPQQLGLG